MNGDVPTLVLHFFRKTPTHASYACHLLKQAPSPPGRTRGGEEKKKGEPTLGGGVYNRGAGVAFPMYARANRWGAHGPSPTYLAICLNAASTATD